MKKLSMVIPVKDEERNIPILAKEIVSLFKNIKKDYEVIFIDDGSRDNTLNVLKELNRRNKNLRFVSLKKNFGKTIALSVGFSIAEGDIIITMDGDLQDDPSDIPAIINKINLGYDFVNGWKTNKHFEHSIISAFFSRLFNGLAKLIFGMKINDLNCPFKAYKKEVAKNIKLYGDMHRYIPILVRNEGFKIGEIKVKNRPRRYGKAKYGSTRLLKGSLDLITIKYLTTFKKSPLHLFGSTGILLFIIGFLIDLYLTIRKFALKLSIAKEPLLLLGILLMVVGVQFISLGLLGETIISFETKSDNLFKIREKSK